MSHPQPGHDYSEQTNRESDSDYKKRAAKGKALKKKVSYTKNVDGSYNKFNWKPVKKVDSAGMRAKAKNLAEAKKNPNWAKNKPF